MFHTVFWCVTARLDLLAASPVNRMRSRLCDRNHRTYSGAALQLRACPPAHHLQQDVCREGMTLPTSLR